MNGKLLAATPRIPEAPFPRGEASVLLHAPESTLRSIIPAHEVPAELGNLRRDIAPHHLAKIFASQTQAYHSRMELQTASGISKPAPPASPQSLAFASEIGERILNRLRLEGGQELILLLRELGRSLASGRLRPPSKDRFQSELLVGLEHTSGHAQGLSPDVVIFLAATIHQSWCEVVKSSPKFKTHQSGTAPQLSTQGVLLQEIARLPMMVRNFDALGGLTLALQIGKMPQGAFDAYLASATPGNPRSLNLHMWQVDSGSTVRPFSGIRDGGSIGTLEFSRTAHLTSDQMPLTWSRRRGFVEETPSSAQVLNTIRKACVEAEEATLLPDTFRLIEGKGYFAREFDVVLEKLRSVTERREEWLQQAERVLKAFPDLCQKWPLPTDHTPMLNESEKYAVKGLAFLEAFYQYEVELLRIHLQNEAAEYPKLDIRLELISGAAPNAQSISDIEALVRDVQRKTEISGLNEGGGIRFNYYSADFLKNVLDEGGRILVQYSGDQLDGFVLYFAPGRISSALISAPYDLRNSSEISYCELILSSAMRPSGTFSNLVAGMLAQLNILRANYSEGDAYGDNRDAISALLHHDHIHLRELDTTVDTPEGSSVSMWRFSVAVEPRRRLRDRRTFLKEGRR